MKAPHIRDIYANSEMIQYWTRFNVAWADGGPKRWWWFLAGWSFVVATRTMETAAIKLENCSTIPDCSVWVEEVKGGKRETNRVESRGIEIMPEFCPFFREYVDDMKAKGHIWLFPARSSLPTASDRKSALIPWLPKRRREEKHISRYTVHWIFSEVMKLAGLRHLPAQAARRQFATDGDCMPRYRADGSVYYMRREDIMLQLGHKKYETTLTHYRRSPIGERFLHEDRTWHNFIDQRKNKPRLVEMD